MQTFTVTCHYKLNPLGFIRISSSNRDKGGGQFEIPTKDQSRDQLGKILIDTLIRFAEITIEKGNTEWCVVTIASGVVHNYGSDIGAFVKDLLKDYVEFDAA